jgi:hypothetical protein
MDNKIVPLDAEPDGFGDWKERIEDILFEFSVSVAKEILMNQSPSMTGWTAERVEEHRGGLERVVVRVFEANMTESAVRKVKKSGFFSPQAERDGVAYWGIINKEWVVSRPGRYPVKNQINKPSAAVPFEGGCAICREDKNGFWYAHNTSEHVRGRITAEDLAERYRDRKGRGAYVPTKGSTRVKKESAAPSEDRPFEEGCKTCREEKNGFWFNHNTSEHVRGRITAEDLAERYRDRKSRGAYVPTKGSTRVKKESAAPSEDRPFEEGCKTCREEKNGFWFNHNTSEHVSGSITAEDLAQRDRDRKGRGAYFPTKRHKGGRL